MGRLNLDEVAFISAEQHNLMSISSVQPSDILLNITGASIGRCCLVPSEIKVANVNQHVCVIRAAQTIDPGYVAAFLISRFGQRQIDSFQSGGSREGLNYSQIRAIELPIPTLPQQRRIAAILSTWDDALERLSTQIDKKNHVFASLREHLIHGAVRIGQRNNEWPMVTLSDVTTPLTKRNGAQYSRDRVMGVTKAEGVVPMREHVVAEDISRYLVLPPKGFAYNPMRINIGSIAMSHHPGDVIVSPDYVVFACREERLRSRFLDHLRRTKAWADYMTIAGNGSVRVRIYYADLGGFEFHLPSVDEQDVIIDILSDGERELAALQTERSALTKQRDALATELLTGRLRVREAEVAL